MPKFNVGDTVIYRATDTAGYGGLSGSRVKIVRYDGEGVAYPYTIKPEFRHVEYPVRENELEEVA